MIDIIIFSKDRACQLDACLRSIKLNIKVPHKISVLHTYSHDSFLKGYELVSNLNIGINFYFEINFKWQVLSLIKNSQNKLIMFLMDDNLVKEEIIQTEYIERFEYDVNFKAACCAISTRLGQNVDYCYAINRHSPIPEMFGNHWNWTIAQGDWGWSMSLDGNIYRREDLIGYLDKLEFSNPNTMEGSMSVNRLPQCLMMHLGSQKVINIPANRVQSFYENRHGNLISAQELNDLFISGKRIKLQPLFDAKVNACHVELPYEFE